MPQVPYKGYPDLGPERVPAHVDVPGAIFEGTKALEGFGRELRGAGEELFQRAMTMKAEQNTVEADEANVEYMTQAGELHAAYNAKQGEDRVKAYPEYKANLTNLRNGIASTLSNDQSRKLFLGKSVGTLSHSIFNGAGAAATAQKDWEKNTADAGVAAATLEYSNNPNPNSLAKVDEAARRSANAARGGGLTSPMAEQAAIIATSNALLQGIQTVARNNYVAAEEMMNQNWHRLTPDDKVRANSIVTTQSTQLSGDEIGSSVLLWGQGTETRPAKSLSEMQTEVLKRVEQRDPEGKLPLLRKTAMAALSTGYNQDKHAKRVDEDTRIQEITGIIMKNSPRTMSELLKDPVANDIYYKMDETNKLKVQGTINSWLQRSTYIENSDNFKKLRSQASDDTVKFMETNPSDWKVSNGDWKTLYNIRQKILKGGAVNDPRTDRAMNWLRAKYGNTMNDLGIDKTRFPENYHNFRGGLAIALDQFQENNNKPAQEKDVTGEIWQQMRVEAKRPRQIPLLGIDVPILGTTTDPIWKIPVPNDERLRKSLKEEVMKHAPAGRAEPDESELQFEYHKQLWKMLNKNKKEP